MDGGIMVDTPEGIEAFRLLSIHGRLKMEMVGLRFRVATFPAVRKQFGFKGSRQQVFDAYEAMLRERGLLRADG